MRKADYRSRIVRAASPGTGCRGMCAWWVCSGWPSRHSIQWGRWFSTFSRTHCFAHMRELGAPEAPTAFLRPLLSVVAILLLAKAALGFLAGWGLLQHEKWARIIALVLAFVSLFTNIPFGTALGVYTMWVLLPSESEREYDALAEMKAA
jgi:hypothetical protein